MLRWKRFVQGDEDVWAANTKKFTEMTGIEVRVDAEGWEDVRPKAAVAANVGSGPGHHHQHDGGRAPVSRQARRRHRPRQLPRQQVRRLVRRGKAYGMHGKNVGRDHDGRRRQRDRRTARARSRPRASTPFRRTWRASSSCARR